MRTRHTRAHRCIVCLIAVLLALAADSPLGASDLPPVEPGFTRIFNGRDLTGWKVVNGKTAAWRVEDGVLHADRGGNWIAWKERLADFVLRLDWKISEEGNSGVFIRVPTDTTNRPWIDGFEVQISNAMRDPEHCTGTLYGVVGIDEVLSKTGNASWRADWHEKQEAPDVWHSYEIICVGKRVIVRVDSVECINASPNTHTKDDELRLLEGFIGVQDSHAGEGSWVQYRNIRIARLNADGLVDGFKRISATERGWHKIKTGHGSGGLWQLVDGAWVGEQDPPGSGNGGVLVSDGRYGDFDLVIEANPDWGCCSGIFLRCTERGQCYQIMVDHHGSGNVGSIYGEGSGGFSNRNYNLNPAKGVDPVANPVGNVPFPIDPANWSRRWNYDGYNEIRARVSGNPPTIEVWVNGVYLTKFTDDRLRKQLSADGKGAVGIQVHGGKSWPKGKRVRYRNIQVRKR